MDPSDDAVKPLGKTVLEVLIEKHPEQRIPIAEDFMPCDPLPAMIQPTITNAHIEIQQGNYQEVQALVVLTHFSYREF